MGNLMSKRKLSESVGWSEANGRRWVKQFKEYIPFVKEGKKIYYTQESYRILSIIKKINENGLTSTEILEIFSSEGVPKQEVEISQVRSEERRVG